MDKPKKIKQLFKGQRDEENIILLLHRHPATLFSSIAKPLVIAIVIIIILVVYVYSNPALFVALFALLIISLLWIAYEWACWWLDIFIITDQRLIDFNQETLFSKKVSETSWDKVQDVTYEVKGVLATLCNFGSVLVQTAGAIGVINFVQVAEPDKIQALIVDVQKDPSRYTAMAQELKSGFKQKKID